MITGTHRLIKEQQTKNAGSVNLSMHVRYVVFQIQMFFVNTILYKVMHVHIAICEMAYKKILGGICYGIGKSSKIY